MSLDLVPLSMDERITIIRCNLFTPGYRGNWGMPLIMEGNPGVGKSRVIEDLCARLGLPCTTLIAATREPVDFSGIPVPRAFVKDDKHYYEVVRAIDAWARKLVQDEIGVVFLDEITDVARLTQAALMQLVHERRFGEVKLPKGVRMLASGNPPEASTTGGELSGTLANRHGWLPWTPPTKREWQFWMLQNCQESAEGTEIKAEMDPRKEQERVTALWPSFFPQATGRVCAFIDSRDESMLYNMPAADNPKRSKAWPSHRSWELATRALAGAKLHKLPVSLQHTFMAAFVGEGPVGEFASFERALDLLPPEEYLSGRASWKHDPRRLDRTAAIMNCCSGHLRTLDRKSKGFPVLLEGMYALMEQVVDTDVDALVVAFANLACGQPPLWSNSKLANKIFAALEEPLTASGFKSLRTR